MWQLYQSLSGQLGGFAGEISTGILVVRGAVAEQVEAWSTYLLAWLGILAFFGSLLGIAQSRRDVKRARTLDYLSRLSAGDFASIDAKVITFLFTADPRAFIPGARLVGPPRPATSQEVGSAFETLDIEARAQVTRVLNLYEELSCSYREKLLDKSVAAKMLLPTIRYAWEAAEPFISYRRGLVEDWGRPDLAEEMMEEWEKLAGEPKPGEKSFDLLEALDGTVARVVGVLASALVIAGLIAVGVAAATHDDSGVVDPFFFVLVAAFAVLAVLVAALTRAPSPRGWLLTATLAGTLALTCTAALTIALDLTAKIGPSGSTGPTGVTGRPGSPGPAGVQGPTGEDGTRGPSGKRGRVGEAGPSGPTGPTGPAIIGS